MKEKKMITCRTCNKEKEFYAKGQCRYCYGREHRDKNKQRECNRRWKEKHPDYFKDYYLNHKAIEVQSRFVNYE